MWLSNEQASGLAAKHGTPLFVYSRKLLQERAEELMELRLPFGHVVCYAVKANPHPETIRLFAAAGLHFDASSSYEADELLQQGIAGNKISLASQQSAHNLPELLKAGVQYVATSMHQLELFAVTAGPGSRLALRVNPTFGGGHSKRVCTGGKNSSFGLWHEYLDDALALAARKGIIIDRLLVHVGCGVDSSLWATTTKAALEFVRRMPDVTTLDLGGGYKVARFDSEAETDMQQISEVFAEQLQAFADETGRKLKLEIEPGTWLVAHAGILLSRVDDIVDTGKHGYTFLRLDTGMNDIIRPAMYGSRHRIEVLNDSTEKAEYVVVGHNCETSDILTTMPGDPEGIAPRRMNKAQIGDLVTIADTGAYCASMSTKHYNAFPSAKETLV
jgi:diaminopimelate decarboxylase